MKYKWLALAACALLLLLSATNLSAVLTDEHPRYHQHAERPAYTPCAEHDGQTLCSHLPLVLIETGGAEIPGEPIRNEDGSRSNDVFTTTADGGTLLRASVAVVDHETGNNHPSDAPTLESTIDIRVRGNSSRYFDKHNYLLKTLTDDGSASRDVSMLGMDAFDEWALHGPYLDKSLIRNYMWYNLAGEIMDYAPNVRFCEVLLNGEYQGLYVMTETINSAVDARLQLTEPSKDTVQTSYALRLDRGSGNEAKNIETFSQYALRNLQDVDIVYPSPKWLTPERVAWIAQDFSDFEKSLYSYDYDTEPYAYWEQADRASFVDYFILNEFTCNYDAAGCPPIFTRTCGANTKCASGTSTPPATTTATRWTTPSTSSCNTASGTTCSARTRASWTPLSTATASCGRGFSATRRSAPIWTPWWPGSVPRWSATSPCGATRWQRT